MKINIFDFKKRKNLRRELENSLAFVLTEVFSCCPLEITEINIRFLKAHPSPKGYNEAFARLYKKGVVNLIITPSYDQNKKTRLSLIAHEMVHVRQMMTGELKFIYQPEKNSKYYLFRKKKYTKVYSLDKFDTYKNRRAQINYISKICPWEREPSLTADQLVKKVVV